MHIVAGRHPRYFCKKIRIMLTREEIEQIGRECAEQKMTANPKKLLSFAHYVMSSRGWSDAYLQTVIPSTDCTKIAFCK